MRGMDKHITGALSSVTTAGNFISTCAKEHIDSDPKLFFVIKSPEKRRRKKSKRDQIRGRSHYHCCVPMCNSDGRLHPQLSFHRIPTDLTRRRKWIKNIRREPGINFRMTECTRVCCIHFEKEEIRVSVNGKRLLCSAAVPSLFRWNKADIDEDRRAYKAVTLSINPPRIVQVPDGENQRKLFEERVRLRGVTTCEPHSTEKHREEEIRSVNLDHRYAEQYQAGEWRNWVIEVQSITMQTAA